MRLAYCLLTRVTNSDIRAQGPRNLVLPAFGDLRIHPWSISLDARLPQQDSIMQLMCTVQNRTASESQRRLAQYNTPAGADVVADTGQDPSPRFGWHGLLRGRNHMHFANSARRVGIAPSWLKVSCTVEDACTAFHCLRYTVAMSHHTLLHVQTHISPCNRFPAISLILGCTCDRRRSTAVRYSTVPYADRSGFALPNNHKGKPNGASGAQYSTFPRTVTCFQNKNRFTQW